MPSPQNQSRTNGSGGAGYESDGADYEKDRFFSLVIFLSGAATFALAANVLAAENGSPGLFPIAPQPSPTAPVQNGSQAKQVHTLSSFERAAIAKFVNANRPRDVMEILAVDVVEFGWASVGGGKSDFLVLFDFSGRGYSNRLWIYSRGSAGELKIQEIYGWKMGNFKQMVRDLNGNGEDELIIPELLAGNSEGLWQPMMARRDGRQSTGWRTEDTLKTAAILPPSMTTRSCPGLIRRSAMPKPGSL